MKLRLIGAVVGISLLTLGSTAIRAQNARTLELSFQDGTVTLVASNVTLREILAEWARKGGSTIVNAEKLGGSPVPPMEFKQQPEAQVLRALLSDAPGYGISVRQNAAEGASTIGTVFVLATRSATTSSSYAPPAPSQPVFQPPTQPQAAPRLIQGSPDDEIPPVQPIAGNMPPMTPGSPATQDPNLRTGAGGVITSTKPGVIIPVQGVPPGSVGPGTTPPTVGGRGRQGGGGGNQR